MKAYYILWNKTTHTAKPTVYKNHVDAESDAIRLAGELPGHAIVVLHSICEWETVPQPQLKHTIHSDA